MSTDIDHDIVVVGAGIHGAGVAQAAAAAGHSVCLVERTEIAAGTSSKSSKLIHGGLRYLESGQVGLVREGLAERRWMLGAAPSLVHELPMHIPVYRDMRRSRWTIRAGLTAYAALAGFRRDARFTTIPRDAWADLDGIDTDGLVEVFRYPEAGTDDVALTRAIVASAIAQGAALRMPCEFVGAEVDRNGIAVTVREAGCEPTIRARVLINAAGPWAPTVAAGIHPTRPGPAVELVQGTHVEYEGAPVNGAFYLEAPDGRAVFVLPHGERTLVGTTEVPYEGDPAAVEPTLGEREYLHTVFARRFPIHADRGQVAAWAGLRVLPAGTGQAFRRSRETVFDLDDARRPRVLGIYGGKLTTWCATAEKALARIAPGLPERTRRADPRTLGLG